MNSSFIYLRSDINVLKMPFADYEAKKVVVSNVEIMMFDENGNYRFETNELSRYIVENENILSLESSIDPNVLIDEDVRELIKMHKEYLSESKKKKMVSICCDDLPQSHVIPTHSHVYIHAYKESAPARGHARSCRNSVCGVSGIKLAKAKTSKRNNNYARKTLKKS